MLKMSRCSVAACSVRSHPPVAGWTPFQPILVQPQGIFQTDPGPCPSDADLAEVREYDVCHTRNMRRESSTFHEKAGVVTNARTGW
jgi:hypothetical protein